MSSGYGSGYTGKCCNRKMQLKKFPLRSKAKGYMIDILMIYSCNQCVSEKWWVYRLDANDQCSRLQELGIKSREQWKYRMRFDLIKELMEKGLQTLYAVYVGEKTKLYATNVAHVYKRILSEVK